MKDALDDVRRLGPGQPDLPMYYIGQVGPRKRSDFGLPDCPSISHWYSLPENNPERLV
jgi:hypothetical protein